jgi:hypothetical protein
MTIKQISEQLVTKTQLECIFTAWGSCAEVPTKGKKSLVVWPFNEYAEIVKTEMKSDYGKALYAIKFFRG